MWLIWKTGEVHVVFYGETDGKRSFRRPWHMWEENIEMDLPEVGWSDIALAHDRDKWQALVNRVMNLRVP